MIRGKSFDGRLWQIAVRLARACTSTALALQDAWLFPPSERLASLISCLSLPSPSMFWDSRYSSVLALASRSRESAAKCGDRNKLRASLSSSGKRSSPAVSLLHRQYGQLHEAINEGAPFLVALATIKRDVRRAYKVVQNSSENRFPTSLQPPHRKRSCSPTRTPHIPSLTPSFTRLIYPS